MSSLSQNTKQNSSQKTHKIHRSSREISRKVIAFEEIVKSNPSKSKRSIAKLFKLPNSNIQDWIKKKKQYLELSEETDVFLTSPSGQILLHKIVIACMYNNKCGSSGLPGVREFLHNSGLNRYVASSIGTLHDFWKRCEDCILSFGELWERNLAAKMKQKNISVIADETFFKGKPCLVAIDALSNYILIEINKNDRKAKTWEIELQKSIESHPVTVKQVISDLCGAIKSFTKSLGAIHSPDLFHGQYELSKATAAALSSQERAAAKAYQNAESHFQKKSSEPKRLLIEEKIKQTQELQEAKQERDFQKIVYKEKKERKERSQKARKNLGKSYHPIDLETGKIQSVKSIKKKIEKDLETIKKEAKEANLNYFSMKRIEKGERAFGHMLKYVREYFVFFVTFLLSLKLGRDERKFFKEVIFPLCYFEMIWRRLEKREKERFLKIKEKLRKSYSESLFSLEYKEALMERGKEIAGYFQRSSSSVEGRNGVLSLLMHRFHRLNDKSLKVLTIVHNFGIRRKDDGTTAGERYFGQKHGDLFDHLVETVRIPGKPQMHVKKRLIA